MDSIAHRSQKRYFRFSRCSILIYLILLWVTPIKAQGSPALIRTEPSTLEIVPGQEYEVSVVLENVFEAYGIEVRMAFDPAMIEIIDENPDLDGIQIQKGDFPQPDFPVLLVADNSAGSIAYVVTQTHPTLPASGNGTVFSFRIRGKVDGESELSFDKVEMSNRDGFLIDLMIQNGRVVPAGGEATVTSAAPIILPSATPAQETVSIPSPTANIIEATTEPIESSPTIQGGEGTNSVNPTASPTLLSTQEAQPVAEVPLSTQSAVVDESGQTQDPSMEITSEEASVVGGLDQSVSEESSDQINDNTGDGIEISSETAAETIIQNEPIREEIIDATPETIGSEPSTQQRNGDDETTKDELPNVQQTRGSNMELLFIGTLIFLVLLFIVLLILLARRRSSNF